MITRIALRRNAWRSGSTVLVALLIVAISGSVWAQSFSLDDNPAGGPVGPPGPGIGFGAEDPFGLPVLGFPPGLAPSPSLPLIAPPGTFDGAINSPSPAPGVVPAALQQAGPDGFNLASLSSNKGLTAPFTEPSLQVVFSVDRLSVGAAGTAVAAEAALGQAPGDVYTTTANFSHPGFFAGGLFSAGIPALPSYAGLLPIVVTGPVGNALTYNQGLPAPGIPGFGLMSGPGPFPAIGPASVLPPGVPAGPIGPATHDNVDAFDFIVFNPIPDPPLEVGTYFSIYPNAAAGAGVSSADVFLAPAGAAVAPIVPWAPSFTMGLDTLGPHPIIGTPFSDSLDGFVVWDNGLVGVVEPGIDYALFSLAPGSASLMALGGLVNDADVLFTDFTGLFGTYSPAPLLGLVGDPGGGALPRPAGPFFADGVDALDVVNVPLIGDFDEDFLVAASDIDILWRVIRGIDPDDPGSDDMEDLNGDGYVNEDDVDYLLASLLTAGPGRQYGDADLDGGVGGLDYTAWRLRAVSGWAGGDFDGDGGVGGLDYTLWRTRPTVYPGSVGPHPGGVAQVPEPSSLLLLVLGAASIVAARHRQRPVN